MFFSLQVRRFLCILQQDILRAGMQVAGIQVPHDNNTLYTPGTQTAQVLILKRLLWGAYVLGAGVVAECHHSALCDPGYTLHNKNIKSQKRLCSISGRCVHTQGPARFQTILTKSFKRSFLCLLSLSNKGEVYYCDDTSSLISAQQVTPGLLHRHHRTIRTTRKWAEWAQGPFISLCPRGDSPLPTSHPCTHPRTWAVIGQLPPPTLRIATRMTSS